MGSEAWGWEGGWGQFGDQAFQTGSFKLCPQFMGPTGSHSPSTVMIRNSVPRPPSLFLVQRGFEPSCPGCFFLNFWYLIHRGLVAAISLAVTSAPFNQNCYSPY